MYPQIDPALLYRQPADPLYAHLSQALAATRAPVDPYAYARNVQPGQNVLLNRIGQTDSMLEDQRKRDEEAKKKQQESQSGGAMKGLGLALTALPLLGGLFR
jgi:hypothetical protein